MKAKYNHWLPKLIKVNAIVLFGTAYFKDKEKDISKRLYRHELEHIKQQKKDGIKFYFKYLYEYFISLIKKRSHHKAYLNISYEVKAREAENG